MRSELLSIEPDELKFPFELRKQASCPLRLINLTENHVAFKVKTTSPKKYCVRPNSGVVVPSSGIDVVVTLQPQQEAPPDLQCRDKFLIQSVIVSKGSSVQDISQELFSKESGKEVFETKLKVVYVSPPQPPSPVLESAEEGTSPRSFTLDNSDQKMFSNDMKSKEISELKAKLTELRASVTTLNEERNAAMRKCQLLQQEMAQTLTSKSKAEARQSQKFSLLFVCVIAMISFMLGIIVH
eukprot:TRINITY_DN1672_c0_g1_i1.p1 TRINITY_DN1672_c0_g1~~TRINITY_DN1672_c0_g1_i1.p1  ORF type:complete len:240 (-),score=54.50 TRINITY_DN1672_c0_g1_i1:13-732(-)